MIFYLDKVLFKDATYETFFEKSWVNEVNLICTDLLSKIFKNKYNFTLVPFLIPSIKTIQEDKKADLFLKIDNKTRTLIFADLNNLLLLKEIRDFLFVHAMIDRINYAKAIANQFSQEISVYEEIEERFIIDIHKNFKIFGNYYKPSKDKYKFLCNRNPNDLILDNNSINYEVVRLIAKLKVNMHLNLNKNSHYNKLFLFNRLHLIDKALFCFPKTAIDYVNLFETRILNEIIETVE